MNTVDSHHKRLDTSELALRAKFFIWPRSNFAHIVFFWYMRLFGCPSKHSLHASLLFMHNLQPCYCCLNSGLTVLSIGLQIGGGFQRWMAAHHLQLVERAVRRLPGSADTGAMNCMDPSSPAWHVLNPHLDWMLPSLLQIANNLHSLSTPQAGFSLLHALPSCEHLNGAT